MYVYILYYIVLILPCQAILSYVSIRGELSKYLLQMTEPEDKIFPPV